MEDEASQLGVEGLEGVLLFYYADALATRCPESMPAMGGWAWRWALQATTLTARHGRGGHAQRFWTGACDPEVAETVMKGT